jgi:Cdc6-like AAA superfamily ATPase
VGEDPTKGGHYITVWGPRQRGKSWIMQQAMWQLQNSPAGLPFDVLMINLVYLKMAPDSVGVAQLITNELCEKLGLPPITIQHLSDFYAVFKCDVLRNPLILILDEFDSLAPQTINGLISVFRNIYNTRRDQSGTSTKMDYLLHGMALIGVYGA